MGGRVGFVVRGGGHVVGKATSPPPNARGHGDAEAVVVVFVVVVVSDDVEVWLPRTAEGVGAANAASAADVNVVIVVVASDDADLLLLRSLAEANAASDTVVAALPPFPTSKTPQETEGSPPAIERSLLALE